MTQHDPCRAPRLARHTGGADELDGLFEFGDPLFALRERQKRPSSPYGEQIADVG
jgi:hypothetical protein